MTKREQACLQSAQPSSMKRWTILQVLDWTRGHFEDKGIESARLDAELLISHALGTQRVMLYARFDQILQPDELSKIRDLVARRAKHEPIAYLVGQREFWSLELEVDQHTLIPPPRQPKRSSNAPSPFARTAPKPRSWDVGTGSGCIALALAHELPETTKVFATDTSARALDVARRNADTHGLEVEFLQGNLLEPLAADLKLDAVVANLPYIPSSECEQLMPEVRLHEPRSALDGGADGLDPIRRLIDAAPERLVQGGLLALEAGIEQVPRIVEMLREAHFSDATGHDDASGRPRVASAHRG